MKNWIIVRSRQSENGEILIWHNLTSYSKGRISSYLSCLPVNSKTKIQHILYEVYSIIWLHLFQWFLRNDDFIWLFFSHTKGRIVSLHSILWRKYRSSFWCNYIINKLMYIYNATRFILIVVLNFELPHLEYLNIF